MKKAYLVSQNELIESIASELKKIPEIKAPEWSNFVKTGRHKERPPLREDWWHVRSAAILRTVYARGPIGVSKLRAKYGGKKNRGVKPEKFFPGSGKIIRTMLQQLEKSELIKQAEKGIHKGRIISSKGASLISKTSAKISGPEKPKEKQEKPKKEKTEKKKEAKAKKE